MNNHKYCSGKKSGNQVKVLPHLLHLHPHGQLSNPFFVSSAAVALEMNAQFYSGGQVALLFLVKDSMHNEAIWRAFLEGAAKLRLKAPALKPQPIDLEKVVGGKLHPAMPGLDETRYPGYKIQHGLVPPSKYRKTKYPHVRRRSLLNNITDDIIQDDQDNMTDSESEKQFEEAKGDSYGCPLERPALASEAKRVLESTCYRDVQRCQCNPLIVLVLHFAT